MSTFWMAWQTVQVTPSASKGRRLVDPWVRLPATRADGVVAAFAVAGELDALAVVEQVDVAQVPGGAVGVGVGGLAPFDAGLPDGSGRSIARWERSLGSMNSPVSVVMSEGRKCASLLKWSLYFSAIFAL